MPINDLYKSLASSEIGLSEKTAVIRAGRQRRYFQKGRRFMKEINLFFRQFTNPLVLMLVIVAVISALLKQHSDTIIILFIIFFTGVLGFFQEINAGRAAEKLLDIINIRHSIIRDNKILSVTTPEVVPGDILLLKAGDIVPADCRIINCTELHVNESSLTGESFPVEKEAGELPDDIPLAGKFNCLWKGSSIVSGEARALAVFTTDQTVFGQIEQTLQQNQETAFEKGITRFGYYLLRVTILLSVFILLTNLYFQKPFFNSLLFSLALAVGMAPELLPAIMMFGMASGAKRMMRKKVIVKKLSVIFNLGEVNVLCTDKTGTITEGSIKIAGMVDVQGKPDDWIEKCSYLNSYFQNGFVNPVDEVIRRLAIDCTGYKKLDEIPYDFSRKRLSVAVESSETGKSIITKGAVDSILHISSHFRTGRNSSQQLSATKRKELELLFEKYSSSGLRVLAVASKQINNSKINRNDEDEMVFLGFILIEDPLKESAAASIKRLRKLNVQLKIITGDNRFAAKHAALSLGIKQPKLITGSMLNEMSPESLFIQAASANVFAEIEPYQKERIVKALQKSGAAVAYLGDGINDVSAIHSADAGISTSNAVDAVKETADFVLMEKDLSVVAEGIIEGRKAFSNTMKYVFATTGSTFGNMFSVAGASLLLPFLPMLPKQILLSNLITDFPFLAISSDHVEEEEIRKPLKWNLKYIQRFMIVFGIHSSLFDFLTFYVLFVLFHDKPNHFQTGWFIESVLTELIIIFIIRTRKPFYTLKPGKMLFTAVLTAVLFVLALPLSPLADSLGLKIISYKEAGILAVIILFYVITAEFLKQWFFKPVKKANGSKRMPFAFPHE